MKKLTCTLALSALLLLSGDAVVAEQDAAPLERVARLAGDWVVLDNAGEPTDLRARYEVLAGGAAVSETLLGGTEQETVTLYHGERGLVTVTQVSARGRPERLVPGAERDTGTLRFEADGEIEEAGRLVEVALTPIDADHLRLEWLHSQAEGDPERRSFEMRRETGVADLAAEVARMRVTLESLQQELDRRLKREITVSEQGEKGKKPKKRVMLETRTFPLDPGWNVSGVPFRLTTFEKKHRYASTFASEGDRGVTIAHYGFKAGKNCHVRFNVMGGHAYVAVVEEKRVPPRQIELIPEFAVELEAGRYGDPIDSVSGERWEQPRAVDWDLSEYEGKAVRIYIVDAVTNHYGQLRVSEFSILEEKETE